MFSVSCSRDVIRDHSQVNNNRKSISALTGLRESHMLLRRPIQFESKLEKPKTMNLKKRSKSCKCNILRRREGATAGPIAIIFGMLIKLGFQNSQKVIVRVANGKCCDPYYVRDASG
jgi:hypothetical protein